MSDFFQPLHHSDYNSDNPINLVYRMHKYLRSAGDYPLEEIYANLVLVSRDLFLNVQEMTLWWTFLEEYGFDDRHEFIHTLYYSAYATKEVFSSNQLIDFSYVENNYVENFSQLYCRWAIGKDFRALLLKIPALRFTTIPQFLNKNVDYNDVVSSLTPGEDEEVGKCNPAIRKEVQPKLSKTSVPPSSTLSSDSDTTIFQGDQYLDLMDDFGIEDSWLQDQTMVGTTAAVAEDSFLSSGYEDQDIFSILDL
mmetsp:Transcript_59846/g.68059  ORF Transcript_59846/g.68059 Transcript_59846/m.68059 type:complete len:251 (+) Transcript_59846:143-895(+)